MTERRPNFFSKLTSGIGALIQRQTQSEAEQQTQPEGLEEILSNLE